MHSIFYQFFLSMMMVSLSHANTIDETAILDRINMYRSMHRVAPLSYNENLSVIAMDNAKRIALNESVVAISGLGQNIGKVRNPRKVQSGKRSMDEINITNADATDYIIHAIDSWYSEKSNYNFSDPVNDKTTRRFTQLVWNATEHVGIGYSNCSCNSSDVTFVVVLEFHPAGCFGNLTINVYPVYKPSPVFIPLLPSLMPQSPNTPKPNIPSIYPPIYFVPQQPSQPLIPQYSQQPLIPQYSQQPFSPSSPPTYPPNPPPSPHPPSPHTHGNPPPIPHSLSPYPQPPSPYPPSPYPPSPYPPSPSPQPPHS